MTDSYEAVLSAICQRVRVRHLDLIARFGIERVMSAIEDIAGQFRGVQLDEIGTSDVSCWVHDMERSLSR